MSFSADGTTFTDQEGRVTTVTETTNSTHVRYPGSTTDDVAVTYSGGRVNAVTASGVTTSYGYADSGNERTVTVMRGTLPARVLRFRIDTKQMLSDTWRASPTGPLSTRSYDYSPDANDPSGTLLKRVTEPGGAYTRFSYDARGNVTETRRVSATPGSPPDLVTAASYDTTCGNVITCNRPNTTTDARGGVTNLYYSAVHGGVTTVVGPAPDPAQPSVRPQTDYVWQQLGSDGAPSATGSWVVTGVTSCTTASTCPNSANERRTTFGYGDGLDVTSVTQASGDNAIVATTTMTYDALGDVTAVDGPLPGSADTVQMRYDALRRPLGTVGADPDGSGPQVPLATRTTYNPDGTIASVEMGTDSNPDGSAGGFLLGVPDFSGFTSLQRVTSSYDGYHRKVKDVLTAGGQTFGVTQQSYDGLGRLDCTVTRMDPNQWGGQPDACAAQTGGAQGPDRIVRRSYDGAGRLVSQTSGYGTAAAATESIEGARLDGQVEAVVDAEGNRTSYQYDGFGRPTRTLYPVGAKGANASNAADYEELGYAATGEVTSRRLRDGQVVGYRYDGLGRLVAKDIPNGVYWATDKGYGYDLAGRLTVATDSNGRRLGFGYDALGRRTSQSDNWYAFGNASFGYDVAGRRTRLSWADGNFVSYEYRPTGETRVIRENGGLALATFAYDALGQRASLTRGNGTVTHYGHDAASRLAALKLAGGNQPNAVTFAYNPAGQIASRTASNDAYAWSGHYNVDRSYGVNGLNQLTSAGPTALGYDGRGNLTTSGGASYAYTADNEMASADAGGWVGMPHDPLGRLFHLTQEAGRSLTLLSEGDRLLGEIDNGTGALLRRYVYGPGVDEPLVWYEGAGFADRRYLHADERGSIVAVTDGAGTALAVNSYDEFGIPAPGNLGRFQYTGQKWLPSVGLYDYKARMYSPTLGRFMQTDPIGYGDGLNQYNYVGGDPVNKIDPSGSTECRPGDGGPGDICSYGDQKTLRACGSRGCCYIAS